MFSFGDLEVSAHIPLFEISICKSLNKILIRLIFKF
jgi:hypothetical protein